MQINWEEQLGSETDNPIQDSSWGTKASEALAIKTCGGWGGGRNSKPHRRVHWRDSQGPRMHTNPPTRESAPEGPNLLVGSKGSDWKLAEGQASSTVPSWVPPPHEHHNAATWVTPLWQIPKAPPLTMQQAHRDKKKYGSNERTDQSSTKIQIRDKEIANLSDAQYKTLVSWCSQKWLSMVAK